MPPPPQGTAGPEARPLSVLTRSELGREFELAARVALAEWRTHRRGGTVGWVRHEAIQRVLAEIGRRYLLEQEEEEVRYRLYSL